jgi:hypothetical protein
MNWLPEHMRDQNPAAASVGRRENTFDFPRCSSLASGREASAVLDLVSEASEVIGGMKACAVETENRVKGLAECAVEKLKLADAHIQSSEAERHTAQDALSEVSARLQESELEFARTQSLPIPMESPEHSEMMPPRARASLVGEVVTSLVVDGQSFLTCFARFRRFVNQEIKIPGVKTVHAILDDYAAHKHPKVIEWLVRSRVLLSPSRPHPPRSC